MIYALIILTSVLVVVVIKLYFGQRPAGTVQKQILSMAQTGNKATIQVKKEGEVLHFVVNGQTYKSAAEIPDPGIRLEAEKASELAQLTAQALSQTPPPGFSMSSTHTEKKIQIQTVNGVSHFIVDGVKYESVESIPDPQTRSLVEKLLQIEGKRQTG